MATSGGGGFALQRFAALTLKGIHFLGLANLNVAQNARYIFFNMVKQVLEELKRFTLVLLLGVFLGIATQVNTTA